MTTVVLDNKDLTRALTTGETPVPAEVAADNAAQAAKKEAKDGKAADKSRDRQSGAAKSGETDNGKGAAKGASASESDADDVEGEDGLTPRQKREFTASMLKTIGKKHQQLKEAEEFAAAQYSEKKLADQRAENLQRQLEQLKAQAPAKQVDPDDGKPNREKFETEEAYRDAVDDWRVDQKFKAKEAEAAQRREEERMEEIKAAASARITKALELVPDFQEVTEAAAIRVPDVIAGYMQESEMLAELGYHFAKHPDVLERLAKMRPALALVEVGKIESKLEPFKPSSDGGKASNGAEPSKTGSAKSADPSRTGTNPSQSRAPVITPVTSSSASQVEKSPQDMNIRETITAWQKKQGVNLERRKRH